RASGSEPELRTEWRNVHLCHARPWPRRARDRINRRSGSPEAGRQLGRCARTGVVAVSARLARSAVSETCKRAAGESRHVVVVVAYNGLWQNFAASSRAKRRWWTRAAGPSPDFSPFVPRRTECV